MKLLSPPEGKSQLAAQNASQEVRAIELDKLIVLKRKELGDLDNKYLNDSAGMGARGSSEEQYWKERISVLTREVEGLEGRKKTALMPLVEREEKINDNERALLEREGKISLRESEIESEQQILEDRLDEVSEREQTALEYAQSLEIRASNVSIGESQVQSRQDALVQIVQQVNIDKKVSEDEINRQKAVLKGREIVLEQREAECSKKEASFASREAKILDQYRALQKAKTEINLQNVATGLHSSTRPKP